MSDTPINESQLDQITDAAQALIEKEGFGYNEPIDELELRDLRLRKIRDLNQYEREILQNSFYQTVTNTAGQAFSAGDIAVLIPSTTNYSISLTAGSSSIAFGQATTDLYAGIRVDCGAGMKVDSITVSLRRSGSPSGNVTCQLITGPTTDGGTGYDGDGTVVETSSNTYDADIDLTTSFQDFTFNFTANTIYEGAIFFKIGNGVADASNFFYIKGGTTTGGNARLESLEIDTSTDPDEWNQANDFNFSLEGDFTAGWYKAHGDFQSRVVDPVEVLGTAAQGGTMHLNFSDMWFKQTGLTAGGIYYIDYDNSLTTTQKNNAIGVAVNSTSVKRRKPEGGFDVIQGTYNPASLDSTETYTHSLGLKPSSVIIWAGSQASNMRVGFWGGGNHGTSFDQVYASKHENAAVLWKDYESGGVDYIQALVSDTSDTDIDIARSQSGIYGDTDTIYFTMLLIA